MSLLRLKTYRIKEHEYQSIKAMVLQRILSVAQPKFVFVIGSMVQRVIHAESDFDVVVVFEDEKMLRESKRKLSSLPPLSTPYPVEYIFMSRTRFDKMKNVGGIAFEAIHHGELIYD